MKRIFAWQTDAGMCHMYRTQFPFEMLATSGNWEVSWGAPPPDIFDYDVIVGQRITGHNDLWNDLSENFGGLLVLDLDDDLIDVDPSNTVPFNIYQPQRLGTVTNIRAADVVTVSTPTLAAKVRMWNPDVVVLENRLPRSWLNRHETPVENRVGWAGSPFHAQDFDLDLIAQIQAVPGISLHTIGGHYLPGAQQTGYQALETAMNHFDFWVGLAPLKNCEFNQSKSWCKAFEYAARGIPVVASDVGQYGEWIRRFGGGVLVPPGGSFTGAIQEAIENRRHFSIQAYQAAQSNCIDNHWRKWETVYNGEW